MKWSFSLLLSIFIGGSAWASSADTSYLDYKLGWTPSGLFSLTPTLQLSHELRISRSFLIGAETGYVFYSLIGSNKYSAGYRLRPKLKLVISESNNLRVDIYGFYNYKRYISMRETWVLQGQGAYSRLLPDKKTTVIKGAGIGMDFTMKWIANHFSALRIGGGLGFGTLNNAYKERRPSSFIDTIFSEEGEFKIPIMFWHISLLF